MARNSREKREDAQLLTAGFAPARIAWIRNRTREISDARERAMIERLQAGLTIDPDEMVTYLLDPELDLVGEMPGEELERLRSALGRTRGVLVAVVQPESNAALAGLKPGDQIIRYDGRRVFNVGQLQGLVRAGDRQPSRVEIEIERAGQVKQIVAKGGELGVQTSAVPRSER